MRIQCPACDATYDLPEGAVKAGRPVRCARCATEWMPVPAPVPELAPGPPPSAPEPPRMTPPPPEEPPPEPPPPEPPLPEPPLPEPPLPEPPRPDLRERLAPLGRMSADRAVLAGWVLSLAVLILLGWAAVAWRADVMRAWPPSERAYAAFGLARSVR